MKKQLRRNQSIEDRLGYQIRMLSLRFDDAARSALEKFTISPAKVTALGLIAANPGCEQSALARALSINRASAMKLVNVLEERGLVERRPGRDLRSNALHLTEAGQEGLPKMLEALARSDNLAIGRMTERERATLQDLLTEVLAQPR